ncbi:hypothetical protein Patl1_11099 [Pistacia atlantica]|uniref:Uncharacterized protein n=1 Tax=Pistacia atlantica TaxID=434234 RepID=A0ACC1AAE5_9ROSI|nr:hypothetical protein Patl1_11099 [Pistacia atlantica]
MEFPTYQYQPSPWHYLLTSPAIFSYPIIPQNYVHWTQTPESHIFSADLPASYEDGVLRVSVPRRGFFIHPADVPQTLELLARAA